MTFEAIISEIKAGKYRPVYFLAGEEPFFIDAITDFLSENVLSDTEKSFDQMVLYGRDTDIRTIILSARRFPMMASHQLIIIKEAQQLRTLEGFEHYLDSPMSSTILAFAYKYKKPDKRTKLGKALIEKSVYFESDKIREDKVPAWIIRYLTEKGYQIDQKAASILVDFLGNDLAKIGNELDKLCLLTSSVSIKITAELIEKNIGISKDYNNFELNKALVTGDILKANRIIRYFGSNQRNNPFVLTISSLFYYFSKLLIYHAIAKKSKEDIARELGINPYFVADYQHAANIYSLSKTKLIIALLREYDLKAKGASTATEGDLLKELIYKILH
jgi:DNA polymerase-3 subunit delta